MADALPAAAPLLLPGLLDGRTAAHWLQQLQAQPGGSLPLATALDFDAVLQALRPLLPHLTARLGPAPQLVVSQCWVRRALPPHGWHQDGALHHDFLAPPAPAPPEPLPMWTAWIALTPCGTDAPSLAWVPAPQPALLPVAALTDAAVRARHPRIEHAVLAPGDALLFDGHLLHATHHTPQMHAARTSIELRCIAAGAVPARLQRETLRAWV